MALTYACLALLSIYVIFHRRIIRALEVAYSSANGWHPKTTEGKFNFWTILAFIGFNLWYASLIVLIAVKWVTVPSGGSPYSDIFDAVLICLILSWLTMHFFDWVSEEGKDRDEIEYWKNVACFTNPVLLATFSVPRLISAIAERVIRILFRLLHFLTRFLLAFFKHLKEG